jgi:integrase
MIQDTKTTTKPAPAVLPVLKAHEVKTLLAAPDGRKRKGKRDRALLAVLTLGGLRLIEAMRLRPDNVEVSRGRVRLTFTSAKRKSHARTVTLPPTAAKALTDWIDSAAPRLFVFEGQRGEHLSTRQAENIVARYLKPLRGDLHAHSLRHSYASMVVRESKSIFVAQRLLGHSDVRVTERFYSAFEVSDADAASDLLAEAITRRRKPSAKVA